MYIQYMGWPLCEIPWVRTTARGARNNGNYGSGAEKKRATLCLPPKYTFDEIYTCIDTIMIIISVIYGMIYYIHQFIH